MFAGHGYGSGIPLGRNEVVSAVGIGLSVGAVRLAEIEDCDGIGAGIGDVKRFAVARHCQRDRVVAAVSLAEQAGIEIAVDLAGCGKDDGDLVAICQSDVEAALIVIQKQSGWV